MSVKDRRPSPALFVAIIALVAALGGTAVALPGKGSVDKNDLAKNVVKSKNVKNNSLKGSDIDEPSLGKVPSAARADSAASADSAANATSVGGVRVVAISAFLPEDGSAATVLDVGGFAIDLTCNNTDPNLVATTTAADGFLMSSAVNPQADNVTNTVQDDTFSPADNPDLNPDADDQLHYTTYFDDGTGAGGAQVRAEFSSGFDDGSVDDAGCYIVGSAEVS